MEDNRRILRVERELKEILSGTILHDLKDPLPGFASIVEVKVSRDLRAAKVFVRFVGSAEALAEAEEILNRQRPRIQRHVAETLKVRYCPVLKFVLGGGHPEDSEADRLLASLNRTQR